MFSLGEHFYKQIKGLSMGNRTSGTPAILCMDRFERSHVYDLTPSLAVYVRYVDDIGTVVNNTVEARKLLTTLYSTHPIIKFELELPDQNCFYTNPRH